MVSIAECVRLLISDPSSPQPSGEGDWEHLEGEESQRRATFANSRDGGSAESSPVFLRRETVGEDSLAESDRMKVQTCC